MLLVYGAPKDSIKELEALLKMSAHNTAQVIGLKGYGLQPECQAEFVVLDAPSPSEAIVEQAEKLYLYKAGQLVTCNRRTTELS